MTEGWCDHFFCFCIIFQVDLFKIFDHIFFRNIGSEKCIDLVGIKWYTYRLFFLAVYINHSSDNFTGSHFFNQLAGTVNCILCIIRIQSLFKFTGCIGTKPDFLAGFTDVGSIKACRFK